eukprot:8481561-Ditylum_brightwellii.AAC.1
MSTSEQLCTLTCHTNENQKDVDQQGKSITSFIQQIQAENNSLTEFKDSVQKTDLHINTMEMSTKALKENQACIQANMNSIASKIEQSGQMLQSF